MNPYYESFYDISIYVDIGKNDSYSRVRKLYSDAYNEREKRQRQRETDRRQTLVGIKFMQFNLILLHISLHTFYSINDSLI